MEYFHNHTDVVEQYTTCLAKVILIYMLLYDVYMSI